jgi:hypothetical protein
VVVAEVDIIAQQVAEVMAVAVTEDNKMTVKGETQVSPFVICSDRRIGLYVPMFEKTAY